MARRAAAVWYLLASLLFAQQLGLVHPYAHVPASLDGIVSVLGSTPHTEADAGVCPTCLGTSGFQTSPASGAAMGIAPSLATPLHGAHRLSALPIGAAYLSRAPPSLL